MSYKFKKCAVDDWTVLQQISIETFSQTYEHKNTPENFQRHLEATFNEAQLKKELQNPQIAFYLLEIADETIAFLKLNELEAQTEPRGKEALEIERIYVQATHHRKGIGKYLLEQTLLIAQKQGKRTVWLGVWEENPKAIAFYKSQGFVEVGTHVFRVGEEQQLDYVMEREVGEVKVFQ